MAAASSSLARPLTAGLVTAVVGFASSFAVVLSGLAAQGASPSQAASGLLALSLGMAVGVAILSVRYRMPITLAWSTPGAAMLIGTRAGTVDWSAAVGAFLVVAALTALTGLWGWLARTLAAIPTTIANALLAGVLLPICLSAFTSLARTPLLVAPIMISWLVMLLLAKRWAVPVALAVAVLIVILTLDQQPTASDLLPVITWTTPTFDLAHVVGLAIPLFVVNIASQYAPGVAVMKTFGYTVPWRPTMIVTAGVSAGAAPFGGHAVNLAAISAALAASPEAEPDRDRRWIAAVSAAVAYVILGLASGAAAFVLTHSPSGLIITVAALALLPTLGNALRGALDDERDRIPAMITTVATASGLSLLGLGAAFWGLAFGLVARFLLRRARP